MPSFLDWINNNLAIYAHPAKTPLKDIWWIGFDLIINVSDHIDHKLHAKIADQGVPVYWFPMGESFGMPLENIFGAVSVLWHAEANNHRVFLHCMAGRNRSVMVADCYYYVRQGRHRPYNDSINTIKSAGKIPARNKSLMATFFPMFICCAIIP